LLYELGRLIDDDRATFEDEEFQRLIESGIHQHVERRLTLRAEMAKLLRKAGARPDRIVHAVEDVESPLRDIPQIIQSYTAYLFQRLEQCSGINPDERVTTAADVLLETPEDRAAAEVSIDLLGSIRSAVSARVLAHVISEPLLDEDLEAKSYAYLRSMWPLPRDYILYCLKPHAHEDLPFKWFQLLVDCDEPSAVDRILEELVIHGGDQEYYEDLFALIGLLERARDPEIEDKVLQVLNSENVPNPVKKMLQDFLKKSTTQSLGLEKDNPWTGLDRVYAANRRYLAAAKLYDAGQKTEAARLLDELLRDDPQHPFAIMLRELT
jgi:hypothetical protein